jgi:hypothetical protein
VPRVADIDGLVSCADVGIVALEQDRADGTLTEVTYHALRLL